MTIKMNRIIFDIETAGEEWDELDKESQKYLMRFAKTRPEKKLEKQRLALYPLTAEIICIGMLNPDTNKGAVCYRTPEFSGQQEFIDGNINYVSGSEIKILERFWQAIKHYQQFITFNGRAFDCPFLLTRSAILGARATKNLMPYRYSADTHIDLLEQLTFYGAGRKFSLDFYCKVFGIESPKSHGITGLDVPRLFREGRTLEVAKYCAGDLQATKELYQRWKDSISF
ncbi:3'-5' exonuclease [Candidatus Falkowbacteria bacterium CG10_big_fil_rev_8_21_14_0_10_43_10]|uniref:3'-5' exonuclease n=1 Tax=Candidatus Falkowbacteria bacterium CG10_big_fil_rev_8_21_14_0_10_43_10 TaxID=1974567 RepID=A0A2H0V269_9BACT|nr:MAG: 3'-5' exonuclease [Candidatus Falkowbacteria bacterium CG10_big_fil_rev_8_21_14_0_10_43_10]